MKFAPGLLLALATAAIPTPSGAPAAAPASPGAAERTKVALLVDLSSGRTLCEQHGNVPFPPASMTKAMTALVVFDRIAAGQLSEDAVVTVSPETATRWAGRGTTLNLKPGEQVTIGDLLMGATTVSANDAAVALAQSTSGSTEAFVSAMNARAQELGMAHTRFGTPNGFPDHGATMVTARDLTLLAQALIADHPALYRRYIGKPAMMWHGQRLTSHDPFAGTMPGADGIKTGHSFEAGFNFLGAVVRRGRRLVLVVGSARTETDRANAARDMVEWGYAAWDSRPFLAAGSIVGSARVQGGDARRVPLTVARPFSLTWPKGGNPAVSGTVIYEGPLKAPLAKGQPVARLVLQMPGQPDYDLPLVTARAVGKAGPFDRLANGLLGLFE